MAREKERSRSLEEPLLRSSFNDLSASDDRTASELAQTAAAHPRRMAELQPMVAKSTGGSRTADWAVTPAEAGTAWTSTHDSGRRASRPGWASVDAKPWCCAPLAKPHLVSCSPRAPA